MNHTDNTQCAWCLQEAGEQTQPGQSHGICPRHREEFLREYAGTFTDMERAAGMRDMLMCLPEAAVPAQHPTFHSKDPCELAKEPCTRGWKPAAADLQDDKDPVLPTLELATQGLWPWAMRLGWGIVLFLLGALLGANLVVWWP